MANLQFTRTIQGKTQVALVADVEANVEGWDNEAVAVRYFTTWTDREYFTTTDKAVEWLLGLGYRAATTAAVSAAIRVG